MIYIVYVEVDFIIVPRKGSFYFYTVRWDKRRAWIQLVPGMGLGVTKLNLNPCSENHYLSLIHI